MCHNERERRRKEGDVPFGGAKPGAFLGSRGGKERRCLRYRQRGFGGFAGKKRELERRENKKIPFSNYHCFSKGEGKNIR